MTEPRYRHVVPSPELDRIRIRTAIVALEAVNERAKWERLAPIRQELELEFARTDIQPVDPRLTSITEEGR